MTMTLNKQFIINTNTPRKQQTKILKKRVTTKPTNLTKKDFIYRNKLPFKKLHYLCGLV